jgi:predicted metal-dependent hydrolase
MAERVGIAGLAIEIERKPIKHLHLVVYPPDGRVRIAAPEGMTLDAIRIFAIGKLPWVRRQQKRLHEQQREGDLEYINRESHYLWGRRYLLRVIEADAPPKVTLRARTIDLHVRHGASLDQRDDLFQSWYRSQMRLAIEPLLTKWQPLLRVKVERVHLQRMKTKWGSCNTPLRSIRLNTELAKKPLPCLEFILVHELAHLRHRNHGARFTALLDDALPQWRDIRDELNRLPLASAE